MHQYILVLMLFCISPSAHTQTIYPFRDIKLEKPSDYTETESMALSAARFLLSTPFDELNQDRAGALQFLSNWMLGNKTYSFYNNGKVAELNTDNNLLSLFVAAMAKYTLENKEKSANPLHVDQEAAKLVIAYCDEPQNHFKLKNKYRKILEKK